MHLPNHQIRLRVPRKHMPKAVAALLGLFMVGALWGGSDAPVLQAAAASNCGLASAAAFCDTFDAPSPNGAGTRSGDLDGVVWGVSRATSADNPSQGQKYYWPAATMNRCGSNVTVAPERDVQICNGQLFDVLNDGGESRDGQGNGAVAELAMYPRQPFDFAGRTGTIAFDVGNDTQGSHMAWPEIVITDQPVPAPHGEASSLNDDARNSWGVPLDADCRNGQFVENGTGDSWGVNAPYTTKNYQFAGQNYSPMGCVHKGSPGAMNHVEIRISQTHQEVWATEPGQSTLKELASSNATLPLTRGLVWMTDVHYNACKGLGTQCNHTFAWDNFGFDGQVLPRDLGFDVLDATHSGTSGGNLGWLVPTGGSLTLQVPNVHSVSSASAALLEFTWWPHGNDSLTYSLNGHPAHTQAWPYGNGGAQASETLAVSVPLSEVVNGTNSVTWTSSDNQVGGVDIANIDLILSGAGGGGGGSTPTATPVPPTRTPIPPSVTPTTGPTSTPTPVPASTATPTPTTQVQACEVVAVLNGVQRTFSRPASFCTDQ